MARFSGGAGGGSGVPGPAGPQGESAYEIAVDNGFVGTEQEWLDSLGGGGNADIADFIFTSNEGESVISLPGDKGMRIEAGVDSDLYLTAGDDLYIQTLGQGDDIHISAADDIRFSANNENADTETVYGWRMDSEGNFQLPGSGYISNPSSVTYIQNNRVDTYSNNYLNDSTGLNNTSAVFLPVDETTMWYVMNQGSFTSPVTITFQDSTTVTTVAIYDATSQGTPAVIFQWNTGDLVKTFEETFPLNISVAYQTPSYGQDTIVLNPADYGNDQYIVIDPTAPNHIHIRAGGQIDQSSAELILGGELANVRVADWSHEVILGSANAGTETTYNWNFNNSGIIYGPGDGGETAFTKISTTNNDGTGQNVKIGDDAWIGDLNVANHIAITGLQDSGEAGIILGAAATERISSSNGDLSIISGNAMTIEAAGGDMNFYMDGAAYIGPSVPDNRIAQIKDLNNYNNALGQVVPYSATWSGDGLAYTGSPVTASYVKIGKLVQVQVDVEMDNVTNFGTGQYSITLPFSSAYHTDVFGGSIHNTGATTEHYSIKGHLSPSSSAATLWYISGSSQDMAFDHNSPINLTTGDKFHMSFSYICE